MPPSPCSARSWTSSKKAAAATAHAVVVDDALYVVDCGNGVGRQLALANIPILSLRHIFITHHHSDHNADYGNLLSLAWATGLGTRMDTWGPPPLAKMTELFLQMNVADLDVRVKDEGRPPLGPLVHPHEVTTGGLVMQDERVKVTAALVEQSEALQRLVQGGIVTPVERRQADAEVATRDLALGQLIKDSERLLGGTSHSLGSRGRVILTDDLNLGHW